MSNGVGIHIIKRDGTSVPLDINKIHFVVEEACEGLSNVSASQVEMTANIQFYDGMSTEEIQIALQDLYLILSDKGLTDTATAINCAEDTLMNEVTT